MWVLDYPSPGCVVAALGGAASALVVVAAGDRRLPVAEPLAIYFHDLLCPVAARVLVAHPGRCSNEDMCGRCTLRTKLNLLLSQFAAERAEGAEWEPRYNVPPATNVPAVRLVEGKRRLARFKWGLIPSWAKDAKDAKDAKIA